mmetsp:Transcript_57459/g.136622  ORF Transcript_57459/g.136622 Transcript_57459/m.136622 type:complete len:484 (+) Transcript_57459:127-1578(+)|eukprot:CAMPEP_0178425704 /NCGR_PEP_ID=MMETSP0689_2-20121128/28858_1 /TAXON_ID=160604 /ORGANISM="Amphidinium massartii, Strain CS-259" /LENGTH=483 /DNA_ID=CAMNT_0020047371 /DNA_START=64 /DNA_END=1515 /DNA_ORIENTATION=-
MAGGKLVTESTPLVNKGARKDQEGEQWPPTYTCVMAMCASLNSVNLGYDMSVNSGVSVLIQRQWSLSSWQVGWYMGSLIFIEGAGALLNAWLVDFLGRRKALAAAQVLFVLGVVLSATAADFLHLMMGRIGVGLGIGISMAIDPLYVAEIAPADHRGLLSTLPELGLNLGILLGFASNRLLLPLPDDVNWRVMLALGLVLPLILLVLALFILPESPRWLLLHSRREEAADVLRRTHATGTDIQPVVDGLAKQAEEATSSGGWTDLFRALATPGSTRQQLVTAIGIAIAQQATGEPSVLLFSPRIFDAAGAVPLQEELMLTMLLGIVKTAAVLVAALLIDNVGRRPLLVGSTSAMALFYVTLAVGIWLQIRLLTIFSVMLFMAAFSIGMGPLCWLLMSEFCPLAFRGKGTAVAVFSNRIVGAIISTTFLPLSDTLTSAGYFACFAGITAAIAVVFACTIPETKRLTLEQIGDESHRQYVGNHAA